MACRSAAWTGEYRYGLSDAYGVGVRESEASPDGQRAPDSRQRKRASKDAAAIVGRPRPSLRSTVTLLIIVFHDFGARLSRPLIGIFWDRLAISVTEISLSTITNSCYTAPTRPNRNSSKQSLCVPKT